MGVGLKNMERSYRKVDCKGKWRKIFIENNEGGWYKDNDWLENRKIKWKERLMAFKNVGMGGNNTKFWTVGAKMKKG